MNQKNFSREIKEKIRKLTQENDVLFGWFLKQYKRETRRTMAGS